MLTAVRRSFNQFGSPKIDRRCIGHINTMAVRVDSGELSEIEIAISQCVKAVRNPSKEVAYARYCMSMVQYIVSC
jgi:hypothetical protein